MINYEVVVVEVASSEVSWAIAEHWPRKRETVSS